MLIEGDFAEGLPNASPNRVIQEERQWFTLPRQPDAANPATGLAVSRWSGHAQEPDEVTTEIKADRYVLSVSLRPMDLTVFTAHKLLSAGTQRVRRGDN